MLECVHHHSASRLPDPVEGSHEIVFAALDRPYIGIVHEWYKALGMFGTCMLSCTGLMERNVDLTVPVLQAGSLAIFSSGLPYWLALHRYIQVCIALSVPSQTTFPVLPSTSLIFRIKNPEKTMECCNFVYSSVD